MRASVSPRIPCVPQITVPKILLIVSGPRAGRRAVDLRPAGRSGRQFARLGGQFPLYSARASAALGEIREDH